MANFDSKYAFSFLKKISFERKSGTTEEKKAAKIIADELKKLGLKPKTETFQHVNFKVGNASIQVTAPYKKKYKAWPIGYSKSTPPAGVSLPVEYVDSPASAVADDLKGKAMLTEGGMTAKVYKRLKEAGLGAVIKICGPERDTYYKYLYQATLDEGRIPGVSVKYEHGLEMVKKKASKAKIKSKATNPKTTSQNVIAEVKGTRFPKEVILVGGHYDSVPWSTGALDNGAGSAAVLGLAKYFAKNPLARTLRFVWFGSEELGLLGSWNYQKKRRKELKNVKAMLNLDVGGMLVGRLAARVTGKDDFVNFIKTLGKETGTLDDTQAGVYSSDCTPIAEKGVPVLSLLRIGSSASHIHSAGDVIEHCGPEAFDALGDYSVLFLERLGNAVNFPFEKGHPEKIQKQLREYIEGRGRKFNYEKE